ncbi:hypothetical protein [Paraflavitalea devenefica]|uniref:hypothetical protein n=1 Tax=Paraflavitalea devenefica TaxID=2716334 RepID=UPI001ABB2A6B|nr:hypothetical protein [Paraflavitalea devenefica]
MFKVIIILMVLCGIYKSSVSQHEHHKTPTKQDSTAKAKKKAPRTQEKVARKDTIPIQQQMHGDHAMNMDTSMRPMDMPMTHAFSLNLPMNRNSSGTAWQPDATPMYGYMKMTKNWNLMFHGSIFFRYNNQDIFSKGVRSDSLTDRFDAPNWVMVMANRKINKRGLLALSLMLSADELVMGGNGYPLLFQSGETSDGKLLIDRQHPHDFVSGLSAAYTHMVNKDIDITAYLGYPGEPAIGPPAFMHRISSMNNPDAPLGHHWQDATHITFGVVTLGFRYKVLKFELSNFTGREPNENRYSFDKPRFDSWSYRFSANPTDNFAIQFSQAYIKSPESLEPEENITRTTASVLHSIILGEKTHLTSAVVWGANQKWDHRPEHSALLESNLQMNRTAIYGRYESIQKSEHELNIDINGLDELFSINALTLGASYNFLHAFNTNFRIGIQGSAFFTPSELRGLYGKLPLSAEIYIHVLPINMNALPGMKHSTMRNHSNH